MRVAVMSLTRDRLDYTRHCFDTLHRYAGVRFDHYVLDQGSQDGTADWLRDEYRPKWVELLPDNIGISRGINRLLDQAGDRYDVIVKFDNDCELTVPDTLIACCRVALDSCNLIASPHIQGLVNPPSVERYGDQSGYRIGYPSMLGGIFMASPAWMYEQYRHNESNPTWGMDDVSLVQWVRGQGGDACYLLDYPAWHYETTLGQEARYPDYFTRKHTEQGF